AEETAEQPAGVFDMIFQFEHMKLWAEEESRETFDLVNFKRILSRWQNALEGKGWNALYLENHDQARSINTFADADNWYASATALATCYFLMKGTPFIYQGQEIGMINHHFASLDDFQDVSARNLIAKLRQKGKSDAQILALLNQVSRDHSRLPMQWNDSPFAGFSAARPWITVNPNYLQINVAQQQADPHSVWHFYRRMIALRKAHTSLITGRYQLLLENDPQIYAYQRIAEDGVCTIITNLSGRDARVELDIAGLGECVLHNQPSDADVGAFTANSLAPPYAAYVFIQKNTQ
ncbi:MAG: alpha-amylase family glycosyl hydrolase, partial [Vibrionaceae bacterium]